MENNDIFNITQKTLELCRAKAEKTKSDFWKNAYKFLSDYYEGKIQKLTPKQSQWLFSIKPQLEPHDPIFRQYIDSMFGSIIVKEDDIKRIIWGSDQNNSIEQPTITYEDKSNIQLTEDWLPQIEPTKCDMVLTQFDDQTLTQNKFISRQAEIIETPDIKPTNEINPEKRKQVLKRIGNWGEKAVFHNLMNQLKVKYKNFRSELVNYTFEVFPNNSQSPIVTLRLMNEANKEQTGYDLLLIENNTPTYIEVKSSISNDKESFELSHQQWNCLVQFKEQYAIYRVINAGTSSASVTVIKNPLQYICSGYIKIESIKMQL